MLPIERVARWFANRKTKCRNCGAPIPAGRADYCSSACHEDFADWMSI